MYMKCIWVFEVYVMGKGGLYAVGTFTHWSEGRRRGGGREEF
jgi:hypothetical protein